MALSAPAPALGSYEPGYEPIVRQFAAQIANGQEVGAGVAVFHKGRCVVDLWGGQASAAPQTPWNRDTRIVVFSASKGLAAMAMHMLVEQGKLKWDERVATYWPKFAQNGKADITVEMLLSHRAGLPYLDQKLSMSDVAGGNPKKLLKALEKQKPAWKPGEGQGYHGITFGLYGDELFLRAAGEPIGEFLRRELLEPLGSDARLGTPAEFDDRFATLYPPQVAHRVGRMIRAAVFEPESTEGRVFRNVVSRRSLGRKVFKNPSAGKSGLSVFNEEMVRRSAMSWVSATSTAMGLARAYLPFAGDGSFEGKRYVSEAAVKALRPRTYWSEQDGVLQKPLGWNRGFLKEERQVFSPNPASFGHAGMGGALGWCDPDSEISFGYVMNRMHWRVRSPRAIALCRALYESPAVIDG